LKLQRHGLKPDGILQDFSKETSVRRERHIGVFAMQGIELAARHLARHVIMDSNGRNGIVVDMGTSGGRAPSLSASRRRRHPLMRGRCWTVTRSRLDLAQTPAAEAVRDAAYGAPSVMAFHHVSREIAVSVDTDQGIT
jgi:hypothetical protein